MNPLFCRLRPLVLGVEIMVCAAGDFLYTGTVHAVAVPPRYGTSIKTDAPLEKKYLQDGPFATASMEKAVSENWKKYKVWYPAELTRTEKTWPLLVLSNGTGVHASSARAMLEHFASWGFIVLGNEEDNSWQGVSAEKGLTWILSENTREGSIFYHRIDTDAIGAFGHSQGGVGTINAITVQPHHGMYKAAVSESPTQLSLAKNLKWSYAPGQVDVPIFYVSSNGFFDSNIVIPPKELERLFDLSVRSPFRVMAIRKKADHGEMLYKADGYVTAWFLYWLKGDENAGTVFRKDGELMKNPLYEHVKIE